MRIGARHVGAGERCYVIAEAGSNHNGKLALALDLIDAAGDAGADAVKFQMFRAERLYPRTAGVSSYLNDPEPIYDIIARMEMPDEWLPALASRCAERRIEFLASVFDEESADRLDPYVAAHKIASYEMTHLPLVRHIARKQKPVVMSTGTATMTEVTTAVAAFTETGNPGLVLMQCTAAYPAPIDTLHTRAIETLRTAFDVPVGLSDHSRNPIVGPLAALACGAAVVEKHFTLSNDMPGPDHRFALEPDELSEMVRTIRAVESAMGRPQKEVGAVEQELRAFARRSIFARVDIVAGHTLSADDLVVLRCGQHEAGFEPDQLTTLIGRRVVRAVKAASVLRATDVE
ncbi:MAG: N-acetylneuraminate synthase family protein [Acidobacteriota bacterium]